MNKKSKTPSQLRAQKRLEAIVPILIIIISICVIYYIVHREPSRTGGQMIIQSFPIENAD